MRPADGDRGVAVAAERGVLVVRPLVDPLIERLGFSLNSAYVEGLWLPVLGPSTTWCLRRLGTWVSAEPDGVEVNLAELAASLGVGGGTGRNSMVMRCIRRMVSFGVAAWSGDELLVRRAVGPLTARQLSRVPERLVALHHSLTAPRSRRAVGIGGR